MKAECVLECRNRLGEGPIWCTREQALWWVDIVAPAIWRFDPASGAQESWPMPEHVGSLSVREAGGLIVAFKRGFGTFDPATGAIEMIDPCEADLGENRFNDGRCDRAGRFWAGSLTYAEDRPLGTLWRLGLDRCATPVLREITAYDFDLEAGVPSNPRLFARVDGPGWPDGSTVDAEGFVWNCEWDGARVVRYAPDGTVDRVVEVPARRATCCAFGGPDLSTLYITSAWDRMSEAERADWPLSGNLFAVDPGVRGLPDPRYLG